ncbi:MAG TPA: hypothetical protein VNJ04_03590 [Gemmatimonadaceae bacterium]|nr:hypothetical protein [Gemmatimonadaceae bacterium]
MTFTISLEVTGSRRTCLFCDEESDRGVNAVVLQQGRDTFAVVCRTCLAASDVVSRIRRNATDHRLQADSLDSIAANLPALPTLAALDEARRVDERAVLMEMASAQATSITNADEETVH